MSFSDDESGASFQFREGSLVYLKPRHSDEDPEPALVKYCGPVPRLGQGNFYGIEILVPSSQGVCNGTIFGKRYFTCKPGSGNFVSANRLMPYKRSESLNEMSRKSKLSPNTTSVVLHLKKNDEPTGSPSYDYNNCPFSPMLDPLPPITPNSSSSIKNNLTHSSSLPEREVNFDDEPNYSPLKLGDRVVWLSDNGPEFGTVRWLGVLPGASSHTMAGVEFDNPVGTGTGLYNRQQLFLTRKKHASFIPLLGLIKADDFVAANSPEHKVHHPVPKAAPVSIVSYSVDHYYKTYLLPVETTVKPKKRVSFKDVPKTRRETIL